jgi:hypothetical protein
LLLSASEDINDLALITKYFKRQNTNYKIQKKISYIDKMEFDGDKLIIDWYLGGRRYLKFVATDVRTVRTGHSWSFEEKSSMHYIFSSLTVSHTKFRKIERNPYEIDLSINPGQHKAERERLEDTILSVTNLQYVMIKNKDKLDLLFICKDLDMYCPNHLHYGAIILALIKQIKFQIRWHKASYKEYKVMNRVCLPPKPRSKHADKRSFNMSFDISSFTMKGEDKAFSKVLIYQEEIVSAMKLKGLNKCIPKDLYSLRNNLKNKNLQENYLIFGRVILLNFSGEKSEI